MKPVYFIPFISIVVLLSYFKTLSNDYSLDDFLYTNQLQQVDEWIDLPEVWQMQFSTVDYRPVASTSFAIEKIMTGSFNPHVSHAVNLLLYLLGVIVFYFFCRKLYPGDYFAPIVAGIFAVLPLHTSMIANIKSRDGLLSFLFGMTAFYLIFYIKSQIPTWKRVGYTVLVGGLFYLSVFSKLDGIMFILAIPLLFLVGYQKVSVKSILRVLILALFFYRISTTVFSYWTTTKTEITADLGEADKTDPLIFTENPIIEYPDISHHLAYAVQTVFEYVKMTFQPSGHYFYYGYDMLPVLPLTHPKVLLEGLFLLALALSAVLYFKRAPVYAFGIFFMFLTLSYCANLIQPIAGIIADRYAYISSAGACIAVGFLLLSSYAWLKKRLHIRYRETSYYGTALILVILFYTPFNIVRAAEWKNILTIVDADLPQIGKRSYEANRIAMKNYIDSGFGQTDPVLRKTYFEKGLQYAKQAIEIYPQNYLPDEGISLAYFGLGEYGLAKQHALYTVAKFDTTLETTYRILNEIYTQENKQDSVLWTLDHLNQAVPNDNALILKYSEVAFKSGHHQEALHFCDSILTKFPKQSGAIQAKAYIYFTLSDSLQAVNYSERAFALGIRDPILFDLTNRYWSTRDQNKLQSLAVYAP